MDVLHVIWPTELNGYRLMLVSFEEVGSKGFYGFKSIVSYTPETGPFATNTNNNKHTTTTNNNDSSSNGNKQWLGKDVIMTLKDGHFTLLQPCYGDTRNSKPWSDYPIDDLVHAIEDYNTEFATQPICLQQYQIGPHLHQEGLVDNNNNNNT